MWSPSKQVFRLIVVGACLLQAVFVADRFYAFLPITEDAEQAEFYTGIGTWFNAGQWSRAWYLVNFGILLTYAGMYFFSDLARWGALIVIIVPWR